jgi:hypothetical protein
MREDIKNSQRFTTSAASKPIYSKDYSLESCYRYGGKETAVICGNAKLQNKFRRHKDCVV